MLLVITLWWNVILNGRKEKVKGNESKQKMDDTCYIVSSA